MWEMHCWLQYRIIFSFTGFSVADNVYRGNASANLHSPLYSYAYDICDIYDTLTLWSINCMKLTQNSSSSSDNGADSILSNIAPHYSVIG